MEEIQTASVRCDNERLDGENAGECAALAVGVLQTVEVEAGR